MAVSKVVCEGQVLMDLTGDTLSSADELAQGITAIDGAGELLTGTATMGETKISYTYSAPDYCVNSDGIQAEFSADGMNQYNFGLSFVGEGKNPECSYLYEDYTSSDFGASSNHYPFDAGSFACYWKIGNTVSLVANLIFNTEASQNSIIIPEGYRPAVDVEANRSYFKVSADGYLTYATSIPSDGYEYAVKACYTVDLGTNEDEE